MGGTDALCSKAQPADGSCGSSVDTCTTGDVSSAGNAADDNHYNRWACSGIYGGDPKVCTTPRSYSWNNTNTQCIDDVGRSVNTARCPALY